MAQHFGHRFLLYSLSGVPIWLVSSVWFWPLLNTSLWASLELAALRIKCSMPFPLRLLLSYVLVGLSVCSTLMTQDDHSQIKENHSVRTISVVLPCANESFVERTVQSIWEATPENELLEIIVVDDASQPPVAAQLRPGFLSKLRVIRQSAAAGLIQSKQRGADAAKGDAIIFLDCHVRPMPNWTFALLRELRANPRRIAVPLITGLDPETWQEMSPDEGGKKMCLTWSVDFFWCNEYPGPVPVLSGGLLAISRSWWRESGGYDSSMRSWGGENIDQSLRTWLCGGEIVYAEGSRVAHMWRDSQNTKTALHYSIPERDVLRNRLRAASAWMGPWLDKVKSFQEFGDIEAGNLADFEELKDRLRCGTFQDYLSRFADLFLGTGMLPSTIFQLKANGKCLTLDLYTRKLHMHDCIGYEGQLWHGSNAFSTEELQCCSGLKLWNYNYCLSWYGGSVLAQDCAYFGTSRYQRFGLAPGPPAMVTAPDIKEDPHCLRPGVASKPVVLVEMSEMAEYMQNVSKLDLVSPGLFRLVTGSGLCLTSGVELVLSWGSCEMAAGLEVIGESHGRKQIKVADQCLDAAQGKDVVLYPCHSPKDRVPNQVFIAEDGGPLCWPFADVGSESHLRCLAEGEVELPDVVLQPCANSLERRADDGQVFYKHWHAEHADSFLLKQARGGLCLEADWDHPIEIDGDEAYLLSTGQCSQRWRHDGQLLQVLSESLSELCLSATDMRPVVTGCWREDLTQHFEMQRLGHGAVALRKRPHWADSGRERFPALCVDTTPSVKVPVTVEPCEGSGWSVLGEEVPLETQIFQRGQNKDK